MQQMKSLIFYRCLALALLLRLSPAHVLQCNVTQAEGLMTYRVPDFNHSGCECLWSNATNFALANGGKKTDDRVVSKSDTTLVTRECIEKILYRRSCVSEKIDREATCETNCTDTPDPRPPTVWIGVGVGVALLLLVVVVALIMRYKRRAPRRRAPDNQDRANLDQLL